jgi:hypothetical protein
VKSKATKKAKTKTVSGYLAKNAEGLMAGLGTTVLARFFAWVG